MERMPDSLDKTLMRSNGGFLRSHALAVTLILVVGGLLALVYAPLLLWIGRVTLQTTQLTTGGALVLFAVYICLRDTLEKVRLQPRVSTEGMGLFTLALVALWLMRFKIVDPLSLSVISFCLAFAAVISFLFGKPGVRQFMPAIGGFLVFGLLVGLVPKLDWPLRTMAGNYAARTLAWLGNPAQLDLSHVGSPQLNLTVNGRTFVVATECNGFGLLTSSALLATIFAFHYRLPWPGKVGLLMFALPLAIVCNFLRIVSICLIAPRVQFPAKWGLDTYHWVHEGLGLFFYYLGLLLIWFVASRQRPPEKPAPANTSTPLPKISGTAPTPVG